MLRIKRILHPTDFSPGAEAAFEQARRLAHRHGAELHLLHVAPTFGEDPARGAFKAATDEDAFYRKLRDEADERMQQLIDAHAEDGHVPVKRVHSRGVEPGEVILDYAASEDVDLIVLGTHSRRGMRRLLLGSVAEKVTHRSQCPVLVVREGKDNGEEAPGERTRRLLAPIEFAPLAVEVLRYARELAALNEATLDVLHVVDLLRHADLYHAGLRNVREVERDLEKKARERLEEVYDKAGGPAGSAAFHTRVGHPAQEIIEFAEHIRPGLIVLASHGRSGMERFLLGSTTERVLRGAPCSVFVTKPFGKSLLPPEAERAEASTLSRSASNA